MIREFQTADTEQVMQIWLNGTEDAHPFISKEYWCSNFSMVMTIDRFSNINIAFFNIIKG